jgi:hypothetical protein
MGLTLASSLNGTRTGARRVTASFHPRNAAMLGSNAQKMLDLNPMNACAVTPSNAL